MKYCKNYQNEWKNSFINELRITTMWQEDTCYQNVTHRLEVSKCCWKNSANSFAWWRVTANLYTVKKNTPPHTHPIRIVMGFLGSTSGKIAACQCGRCKSLRFDPWVRKILWRRKWQPALVFLPGKFHGQRSLLGYSPWGHKESDIIEWLSTAHMWNIIKQNK